MIDIPHEALLFDLFYGGKAAGEETEEDLKGRMKTAVPQVTVETPSFRDIHISISSARVPDAPCSSTDCPKCPSGM